MEMECPICEENRRSDRKPWSRRFSVEKYRKSRDGGCAMCSLVLDAVDAFQPTWAADNLDDGHITDYGGSSGDRWVKLFVLGLWIHQLFVFLQLGASRLPGTV